MSIAEFNRLWSRRVLGQGAMVLLITDGLDRDAGTGLAHEMDRLHRSCRRLIWLNPLLRYEGFEPKSLGMKAMMPHVDEFRPVHNLESLETLIEVLSAPERSAPGRRPWLGGTMRRGRHERYGGNSGAGGALARSGAGRGAGDRGHHLGLVAAAGRRQACGRRQGRMVGSVSGGCVEGAVIDEAQEVITDGKPRLFDFGVTNEQAWEVGLACGGKIQIFVERVE